MLAARRSAARWPLARSEDRFGADLCEIRAIAAGDSAALPAADRPRGAAPAALRHGMLGSLDEAEDAVQDTLIRLWENAARGRPTRASAPGCTASATIARSIVLRRRRACRRRKRARRAAGRERLGRTPRSSAARRCCRCARRSSGCRARQRTAILLFHFQEFSQREAAASWASARTLSRFDAGAGASADARGARLDGRRRDD